MKHIFTILVLSGFATTSHAGYQYGVVCKDSGNAKYLFSDGYAGASGSDSFFVNRTECLAGACREDLLSVTGVTSDGGIGLGRVLDVDQVTDPDLSQLAGPDLRITLAKGQVLLCGERRLLSEIPGH